MENIEFSGGPNVLTESERAAFHDFEQAIESAESYALRMAWPLRSIRDERLYRDDLDHRIRPVDDGSDPHTPKTYRT